MDIESELSKLIVDLKRSPDDFIGRGRSVDMVRCLYKGASDAPFEGLINDADDRIVRVCLWVLVEFTGRSCQHSKNLGAFMKRKDAWVRSLGLEYSWLCRADLSSGIIIPLFFGILDHNMGVATTATRLLIKSTESQWEELHENTAGIIYDDALKYLFFHYEDDDFERVISISKSGNDMERALAVAIALKFRSRDSRILQEIAKSPHKNTSAMANRLMMD